MDPEAQLDAEGLRISWSGVSGAREYDVRIEECDGGGGGGSTHLGGIACRDVFNATVSDGRTEVEDVAVSFDPCKNFYNVRLLSIDESGRKIYKETTLVAKTPEECAGNLETILTTVLALMAVLIIFCLAAIYYYHRRRPQLQRIASLRSKVYTKIYSRDKYERPVSKKEFAERADQLLEQEEEQPTSNGANGSSGGGAGEFLVTGGGSSMQLCKKLEDEFSELEQISFHTIQRRTSVACTVSNRLRNRYHDIVPYDANRVKLQETVKLEGESAGSNYINASYVQTPSGDGGDKRRGSALSSSPSANAIAAARQNNERGVGNAYIAGQGPGDDTLGIFWEMIWENDVRVIVMLTRLVEGYGFSSVKCSQYWPAGPVGSKKRFGDLEVQLFDVQETPDYTVRKFDLSLASGANVVVRRSGSVAGPGAGAEAGALFCAEESTHEIVQVQYTAWPDKAAPAEASALLQLIEVTKALDVRYNSKARAPWLVHCSAGVGRTGTFIAVDQLLKTVDDTTCTDVDVFNQVYQLRKERRHMVQTAAQYAYVYKCVREYIRDKKKKEDSDV